MANASIPVDLFNPGQVFACLGFMELAIALGNDVRAGFDWVDPAETRFVLRVSGSDDPFTAALQFLMDATAEKVRALVPAESNYDLTKWQGTVSELKVDAPFPMPIPDAPATLPAELRAGAHSFQISSWGDGNLPGQLTSGRDNSKFWAGAGGMPGAIILQRTLDLVTVPVAEFRADPFAYSAAQSGGFRFDWRRDYIPIDAGFSLNNQPRISPAGYPLVEALAVIGLAHARPNRPNLRDKLTYCYGVAGRSNAGQSDSDTLLPPILMRAVLGTAQFPFSTRIFTMNLDWPGQEGQARCITTVSEEFQP